MIAIVLVLLLFGAALVAGFRRWGLPGAIGVLVLAQLLLVAWNLWETVAWHRYGDGPAEQVARAIARNWPCHTLDGLPPLVLLGGTATLVLWATRRRFNSWMAQGTTVAVTFAVMAIPTLLAMLIWTTSVLSCDAL